jgi:selenocysteine-specific elongation factor
MSVDLILGTAGHIDHGKTSLIRALTGVDTDRLPEEKRRGITIDLGFAHLELPPYRLGIVDVPGHERFVRNMLAGATGMNLAMLVVAADDSVNQQTREHLDILRLLDLQGGVIALTKSDLADDAWLALVEDEIRQLVAGSPLADAPIVRTSVVTGAGLDELRTALRAAAERAAPRVTADDGAPFRMAIDRTFTVEGHGTVVTGSITSGRVRLGDEVQIEPGGLTARVRGLHNHDLPAEELHRGQRGAINLAGVHHSQIVRGQELTSPGALVPARRLTVRLQLLPTAPAVRNRAQLRVHLGTAEVLATVRLLGRSRLEAGQSALAQLVLAEPAVASWNQPLVIRRESPVETIGGGRVLDPAAQQIRKLDEATARQLAQLESTDEVERAGATLYLAGLRGWQPEDLPRLAAVRDPATARAALAASGELIELPVGPTSVLRLHRLSLESLAERIASVLESIHTREPLRVAIPRAELAARFAKLDNSLLSAAIAHLERAERVHISKSGLALAGHGPQLSRSQQQLLEQMIEWFAAAGLESPGLEECVRRAAKNKDSVPRLLELAAASDQLILVGPGYWLHPQVERQARSQVATAMSGGRSMTLSEIREHLGTTRKYAVPLCEYWDRSGFTNRQGDSRTIRG